MMDENIEVACPRCGATCVTSTVNNTPRRCHTCGCALGLSVSVTNPTPTVTPATDEEVERWRPHFPDGSKDIAARLIARIDAERARADKNRDDLVEAEAARDHEHAEMARQASLAVDWMIDAREAMARAEKAEALLARAIKYADEDCATTPRSTRLARVLNEARAALSRNDGA